MQKAEGRRLKVEGRNWKLLYLLLATCSLLLAPCYAENVAILALEDRSPTEGQFEEEKAYRILAHLLSEGDFTLIDENLVRNVVSREARKAIGEITPEVANSLGQILEADIIGVGSFEYLKDFRPDSLFLEVSFIETKVRNLDPFLSLRMMDFLEASISKEAAVTKFAAGKGESIASFQSALFIPKLGEESLVYVDEKKAGETPLIIKGLKAGEHKLRFKRGQAEKEIKIIVNPGPYAFCHLLLLMINMPEELLVPLVGEEKTLSLTTMPTQAKVYLNDSLKGVTPLVIRNLEPGIYRIKVIKTGYEEVRRRIIFKDGYKLNLRLRPAFGQDRFFLLPQAKTPPYPELLRVPAPFTLKRGDYYLSLDYPTGPVIRYGLKPNFELRLNGPGFGVKAGTGQLGFDAYWTKGDLYHKESALSLSGVYLLKLDSWVGILSLYPGIRFLEYQGKAGFDEGLGLFLGLDFWATDKLKFLAEYDKFEGGAVGLFYDLGKNFTLSFGVGYNPESKIRLDGSFSYCNTW